MGSECCEANGVLKRFATKKTAASCTETAAFV